MGEVFKAEDMQTGIVVTTLGKLGTNQCVLMPAAFALEVKPAEFFHFRFSQCQNSRLAVVTIQGLELIHGIPSLWNYACLESFVKVKMPKSFEEVHPGNGMTIEWVQSPFYNSLYMNGRKRQKNLKFDKYRQTTTPRKRDINAKGLVIFTGCLE